MPKTPRYDFFPDRRDPNIVVARVFFDADTLYDQEMMCAYQLIFGPASGTDKLVRAYVVGKEFADSARAQLEVLNVRGKDYGIEIYAVTPEELEKLFPTR
jgi:hypothetical protein